MNRLKEQLLEVKEQQQELAEVQEDICQRLETLECSGLHPIAEEEAASLDWRTADSAKSVPQG